MDFPCDPSGDNWLEVVSIAPSRLAQEASLEHVNHVPGTYCLCTSDSPKGGAGSIGICVAAGNQGDQFVLEGGLSLPDQSPHPIDRFVY